jgi:dTMP kinase
MPRSLFISLDGLDGTGKSTQCKLLAAWLRDQGQEVCECSDPGGTAVGTVLRRLLLEHRTDIGLPCEALLFMASRAQLTSLIIRPALDRGQVVICDRFLVATVAYQGYGGGLDVELLWSIGRMATAGLEPDLTIVLDLSTEAALARQQGPLDRMESRPADYRSRVRQGFLKEVSRRPDRFCVLDASASVEALQVQVRNAVQTILKKQQAS